MRSSIRTWTLVALLAVAGTLIFESSAQAQYRGRRGYNTAYFGNGYSSGPVYSSGYNTWSPYSGYSASPGYGGYYGGYPAYTYSSPSYYGGNSFSSGFISGSLGMPSYSGYGGYGSPSIGSYAGYRLGSAIFR